MVQTKYIRLSGLVEAIPVSDAAHRRLLAYLADARLALGSDADADETVRDLEASLGEQLLALSAAAGQPVDDHDMARLLADAGEVASVAPGDSIPPRAPFWCRIEQGKTFGGLCLGIAARGEFRIDWVRTIAIFLALGTGGLIGFVYLAALLFLPKVESVEEYERLVGRASRRQP